MWQTLWSSSRPCPPRKLLKHLARRCVMIYAHWNLKKVCLHLPLLVLTFGTLAYFSSFCFYNFCIIHIHTQLYRLLSPHFLPFPWKNKRSSLFTVMLSLSPLCYWQPEGSVHFSFPKCILIDFLSWISNILETILKAIWWNPHPLNSLGADNAAQW